MAQLHTVQLSQETSNFYTDFGTQFDSLKSKALHVLQCRLGHLLKCVVVAASLWKAC